MSSPRMERSKRHCIEHCLDMTMVERKSLLFYAEATRESSNGLDLQTEVLHETTREVLMNNPEGTTVWDVIREVLGV